MKKVAKAPRNPRILIVEEDEFMAVTMGSLLERNGFDIEVILDGRRAMAAFRDFRPDLVLLALMVEHITGFDLLDEIRGDKRCDGIKVLIFTSLTSSDDRQKCMSAGADGYMCKSQATFIDVLREINNLLWPTSGEILREIGRQHEVFQQIVADAQEARYLRSGQRAQMNKVVMRAEGHANAHYNLEERYFRLCNFTFGAAFIAVRDQMLATLDDFRRRQYLGQDITVEFVKYLKDWVQSHLRAWDEIYSKCSPRDESK